MHLSNNALLAIAALFLWQVIGLSIGKLLFFVMFGLGLVAANRDQLQGFLFSAQPASLQRHYLVYWFIYLRICIKTKIFLNAKKTKKDNGKLNSTGNSSFYNPSS